MKALLSKKSWVIFFVIFLIFVLILWQKDRLFGQKIADPLIGRDPSVVLGENLEKAGLSAGHLAVLDKSTIEASVSGVKVFFSPEKDFSEQVRALQLALSRRTIDKVVKEVDLRYNNVVIRY